MRKSPLYIAFFLLGLMGVYAHAQERISLGNYSLMDTRTGKNLSFADFNSQKAVVLVFTSADCAFSMKYQNRINEMAKAFEGKSVSFVAVNSNDSSLNAGDAAKRMRIQMPYTFPYVKDASQEVAAALNASRNPEAFVLIPLGKGSFEIAYRGQIDDNPLDPAFVENHYVKDAIEAILKGEKPPIPKTEATGCNIKWQKS